MRDRNTGLVLETSELHPQEDYDFDPFQGRLTLLRPLSSFAATGETVRTGSSSGNIPVLVVRYEYSPPVGNLAGYTIGGRGTQWLGDTLRLGVTAQRETLDSADQTLIAGDALLRITAGTYVKAELAQTDGPGFGQSASIDGGLNFIDQAAPGLRGTRAQAWRAEGAVNIAELMRISGDRGKLRAHYEHFDRGFSSVGRLTTSDTERWGVGGELPIGTTTQIAFAYDELASADTGRSRTGTFDLTQQLNRGLTGKLGLRLEDRVANQLYNSVQVGRRIDAAAELAWQAPNDNWGMHMFGQATLDRNSTRLANNRFGIGAKATLTERLSAEGAASIGDGGLGLRCQTEPHHGCRFGGLCWLPAGCRPHRHRTVAAEPVRSERARHFCDRSTAAVLGCLVDPRRTAPGPWRDNTKSGPFLRACVHPGQAFLGQRCIRKRSDR